MTKTIGQDALNALNAGDDSSNNAEFSSFKSGTKYIVKVLGKADILQFDSYSVFKVVNSFVAEKPSVKSAKGFPTDKLTPWDKAFMYYRDKSEKFGDDASTEAYKYKPKQRFAMGFYDLDEGKPIVIDVSKKQAQAIHGAIMKNEKRLSTFAFELEKQGESTSTTVSLTPMLDDMTSKQQSNFDEAPEEFGTSNFDGILFELNEEQQIEKLAEAGFDVSLVGLEAPKNGESTEEGEPEYDF